MDMKLSVRSNVLIRARLLAAPGDGSSPMGAEKREGNAGIPFRASPEVGWRCGGRVMVVKQQQERSSAVATHELGEREKGAGRTGGVAPFYRCVRAVRGGGDR
jgi:hypothetical protein